MKQKLKIILIIIGLTSFKSTFSQNNALNFDGIDDYVNLNAVAPAMTGSSNFTIEFWMKADLNNQSSSIRTSLFSINPQTSNGNGLLIILGGANTQEGKLMIYDEGSFGSNSDFTSNIIIGDNNCHHISYVRNGNAGSIYIDGVNVGSHTSNYTLSTTDLYSLGQEWDNLNTTPSPSQFYNGEIDELRIWNTARTVSQIQANMNNELIGNEVGLVAYYNFNQGIPSANNSGVGTLVDNTASGLNGNLNNFALNGATSNWIENLCSRTTSSTNNILLEKITVKLFPNPTSNQLTIVSDELKISEINIADITGEMIKTIKGSTNNVNVSGLPSGIYFIQLITEEGVIAKKFIKQ